MNGDLRQGEVNLEMASVLQIGLITTEGAVRPESVQD